MSESVKPKSGFMSYISRGGSLLFVCSFISCVLCFSVDARVYKVKAVNDEAAEKSQSLQELIDSNVLKGGDVIVLSSGHYGVLSIKAKSNSSAVTIEAAEGQFPAFETIIIEGSRNWVLRKLRVFRNRGRAQGYAPLVDLRSDNAKIVLDGLFIYSSKDSSGWKVNDWKANVSDGISVKGGRELTIRNNRLLNVRNGIRIVSRNSIVESNIIENFAGDGILGAGDDISYKYNQIKNCYRVFGKESDAFQFWSEDSKGKPGKGVSRNGVVLGNYILNSDNPDKQHQCALRGISMFDGMYDNWLIENNVIQINNWRGISAYGTNNLTIVHNTLFNPYTTGKKQPRIDIRRHKSGAASRNNIVINNIAYKVSGARTSVINVGNLSPKRADEIFVDFKNYDLRLKKGSSAVDAAVTPRYFSALSNLKFPFLHGTDISGTPRPQGKGRDLGAYERPYQE